MLKKLCVGLAVGALALAGGVTSLPVAHSQGSHRETVTVISKDNQAHETDVDANNNGRDDAGDYFIGHSQLWHFGRRVGRERHECVEHIARENFFQARCTGTFHINRRGNLEIAGIFTFSRNHAGGNGFSILGGTGDFRDASGRATVGGKEHITKFTFHVIHN